MSKKRGRLQIIHDILNAIKLKGGMIKPTHLLYKSNLSHQMMNDYLKELIGKEFIMEHIAPKNNAKTYSLTRKGYDYLAEYRTVVQFVESFGLEEE
ncbi:winged helix-turn-helix domain-containing protein [Candidatus Woesearchaeota archaeon]|nr:winged helix-turn-helix domain-containing protein [Candidatus Woesearchaeota archaeon]